MSYYMHQSPELMHKFETLSNHIIELVVPIFILLPWRPTRMMAGALQILFQVGFQMLFLCKHDSYIVHIYFGSVVAERLREPNSNSGVSDQQSVGSNPQPGHLCP